MKARLLKYLLLASFATTSWSQSPPQDGLALWLKSDVGVTAQDGLVMSWEDQSPNGNHAGPLSVDYLPTGTEAPALVEDAINELPVVRFDGVDDVLEIPSSTTLQPLSGDWTVIFAGRRVSAGQGDFPQIIGSRPWTAGLDLGWATAMSTEGRLGSHLADGASGHDVPAVLSESAWTDAFEIWQVEEDRTNGKTAFYERGDLDNLLTTSMPTFPVEQFYPTHIGREMGGANNRRANMELAEVLVYNRVLSEQERLEVTSYLAERYGLPFSLNVPPTITLQSPAGGTTVAAGGTIQLTATANDSDGSIARVEFQAGGRVIATATQPPYAAGFETLAAGTLEISAVAVDDRGAEARSAIATVTITGNAPELNDNPALELWLSADTGIVSDGVSLTWEDQSGKGNNASQFDSTLLPEVVPAGLNGLPVLRFDGQDDYLEIPNSPSLQPGSDGWSVIFVASRLAQSQGDFPQVIGSRPWVAGLDSGWAVAYSGAGIPGSHFADGTAGHDVPQTLAANPLSLEAFDIWLVEEDRAEGQTRFYRNSALNRVLSTAMPAGPIEQVESIYIGREIGGANNRRANMDLAEVLVYRGVLSASDRENLSAYLASKYNVPALGSLNQGPSINITAPAPGATLTFGQEATITADVEDEDGSVKEVTFLAGTRVLGTVQQAPYSITVSDLPAGEVSLTVRAVDNLGAVSTSEPLVVVNQVINAPKPLTLIGKIDYSDTFTVGAAGTPDESNPRPNGMHNDNSFGGYNVEETHRNPGAVWTPAVNFSFNTPDNSTAPSITENATGNPGAETGLAQSGSGNFSITYGLRENYIVQVDAILPLDRLDIGSYATAGDSIFTAGGFTVIFRRDSVTGAAGIALHNGVDEAPVVNSSGTPIQLGLDDNNWHQFGVHFNRLTKALGIYVDGVLKAQVDLLTFSEGEYADFSNGAVGVGGAGFNGSHAQWFDNFAVGAPALVGIPDYSDTFTVTNPPRRDGLYNETANGAYNVENTHGNPTVGWAPTANFSFNTPASSTGPDLTTGATGNTGAESGFAQSGGGDFNVPYSLREDFVVSADAILPVDRLDIGTFNAHGGAIDGAGALTLFLRRDGAESGIALSSAGVVTPVTDSSGTPLTTGIEDFNWHNFAVRFNRAEGELEIYIDLALRATVDLAAFAGGAYREFSNAAVGVGGAGFNGTHAQWFDNFAVGAPGPGIGVIPASPELPLLSVTRSGSQIQISWTGPGQLETTSSLGDDWTPVPNSASGMLLDVDQIQAFFRLVR